MPPLFQATEGCLLLFGETGVSNPPDPHLSLHILSVTKCSVMLGTQSHALLSTTGLCSHRVLLLGCTFSTTQSSMDNFLFFSLSSLLFKLLKNNTFMGALENIEQSYIWFHYILQLFFK